MMYNAKVDTNQPAIVADLRRVGAEVLDCHSLKNAFDILVGFRGNLYMIEIKNPEYKPKRGNYDKMLTKGERECKARFEAIGIAYHIVFTTDEALKVIGAI